MLISVKSCKNPTTYSIDDLKTKFKHHTYALTLECRGNGRAEDLRHQDRLHNYGYFGSTAATYNPFFGFVVDEATQMLNFRHLGFTAVNGEFKAGDANSVMAKYNTTNGILNPDLNNVWNNLYNNAGQVYNSFNKSESDLITLNLFSCFIEIPFHIFLMFRKNTLKQLCKILIYIDRCYVV